VLEGCSEVTSHRRYCKGKYRIPSIVSAQNAVRIEIVPASMFVLAVMTLRLRAAVCLHWLFGEVL
jgi:hypothetical protein